jgi:hypothetical protein
VYAAGEPARPSWYRRRWVQIVGVAAAAVLLFVAGGAIGSLISGHDDRGDFRTNDWPGGMYDDGGRGGQMGGGGHGFYRDGDGFRGGSRQNQAPGGRQITPTPQATQ